MRITDEQLAIRKTMPKNPDGHIVNPRYVPPHGWGPGYVKRLGEWCRTHPRHEWPGWLAEYVDERKRAAAGAARADVDGDGGRTEEAGDGGSDGVPGQG